MIQYLHRSLNGYDEHMKEINRMSELLSSHDFDNFDNIVDFAKLVQLSYHFNPYGRYGTLVDLGIKIKNVIDELRQRPLFFYQYNLCNEDGDILMCIGTSEFLDLEVKQSHIQKLNTFLYNLPIWHEDRNDIPEEMIDRLKTFSSRTKNEKIKRLFELSEEKYKLLG